MAGTVYTISPPEVKAATTAGSWVAWATGKGGTSWQVMLMPYYEQTARYEGIAGRGYWTGSAFPENQGSINSLNCPSDPNAFQGFGVDNMLRSNYIGCAGDTGNGMNEDELNTGNAKPIRGAFGRIWVYRGFEAITDGTSNTLLLSETAVSREHEDGMTKGNIAMNINSMTGAGTTPIQNPSNCFAATDPSDKTRLKSAYIMTGQGRKSSRGFQMGFVYSVSFNACLPPNSPSCTPANNSLSTPATSWMSASSYHPGGVTVCLVDGAVRFVPDTIDVGTFLYVAEVPSSSLFENPSRFGVWGSLGSIHGGESSTL